MGIAEKLGLKLISYRDRFPYLRAFALTLRDSSQWDSALLQLPPGPALTGCVIAKRVVKKFNLVCDVHTGMVFFRDIKQVLLNAPFVKQLRKCDYVLAHNKDNAKALGLMGVPSIVIYDPIPQPVSGKKPAIEVNEGGFIVIPAGWDTDEPYDYLIKELGRDALRSFGYKVVITGDYRRTSHGIKYYAALSRIRGVILTGFVPSDEYFWLLRNAAAVLGLTRSSHIMLRAFWEAAAYARPVIAPMSTVTREVMGNYPYYYEVYVNNSLRKAVGELRRNYDEAIRRGEMLSARMKRLSDDSMERLARILGQ